MWLLLAMLVPAHAGDFYEVDDRGRIERIRPLDNGPAVIETWPGRPVELMVIADLSRSVSGNGGLQSWLMADTLLVTLRNMKQANNPQDKLGVTIFARHAEPWVPLGSLDRPGLSRWFAAFGPPDRAPVWCEGRKDVVWSAVPTLPAKCAIGAGTHAGEGLEVARRAFDPHSQALQVAVVIWDGEQYRGKRGLRRELNRLERQGVHVFTILVGDHGRTDARGAGDVYRAPGQSDVAMRHILNQLRF